MQYQIQRRILEWIKYLCILIDVHQFGAYEAFPYRVFQSIVLNSGQKMALRVFYFLRALTKAQTYYCINRSQNHLLAAIENNWFGVLIEMTIVYWLSVAPSSLLFHATSFETTFAKNMTIMEHRRQNTKPSKKPI